MKPTRRTFMQGVAGFFAGLFGSAEAAAEYVEWLQKPKKVMVPGVDFERIRKPTAEEVQRFAPYRTPADRYNPVAGALHQEVLVGEPGFWRSGNYVGREGATYGKLYSEGKVPVGCQLGGRARLIFVDEARKTLKFELVPEYIHDWQARYAYAVRKCPPPRAVVVPGDELGRHPGDFILRTD